MTVIAPASRTATGRPLVDELKEQLEKLPASRAAAVEANTPRWTAENPATM